MSIHKKYDETIVICDSCQEECASGIDFETTMINFILLGGITENINGQYYNWCSFICKKNEKR